MSKFTDQNPEKLFTPVTKSYKNQEFLNSSAARNIRIMCEYEEPYQRLKANNVTATVLVFGSARSKSTEQYNVLKEQMTAAKNALEKGEEVDTNIDYRLAKGYQKADALASVKAQLDRLEAGHWMCEYFDKVTELCKLLTEWAVTPELRLNHGRKVNGVTRSESLQGLSEVQDHDHTPSSDCAKEQKFMVCTGGGPGFMEAANRGASLVPGAKNIGMGISLPFESHINKYVSDELSFEFHYFFTRKFWMVYHCQALVVAPGGVGTMDELFEVLTLKQTGKVQKDLPVVLFGAEYWKTIVNWGALIKYGVVSDKEYEDLVFTDSVEEAYDFIVGRLQTNPHYAVAEEFPKVI